MDWSNEHYARVYTRDTDEWLLLSWEARSLWVLLLRKMDRAGILAAKHGTRSLAALVGMPLEVVQRALPELLEDGCLREYQGGYVAPNFLEAQETSQTDKQRKRESRERRRATSLAPAESVTKPDESVTKPDIESRNVTETSAPVTDGHSSSQLVTLSLAMPGLAKRERESGKPDPASAIAVVAVGEINAIAGTQHKPDAKSTLKLCKALDRAGYKPDDTRPVIQSKRAWARDPKMHTAFVPGTLLALANFERYRDELGAGRPALSHEPHDARPHWQQQRDEIRVIPRLTKGQREPDPYTAETREVAP